MLQNCYKFYKIILIVISILGIFFLYKFLSRPVNKVQNGNIKVVEVENVLVKDIQQTVRLIGTVKSKYSSMLIAKTIGTVDFVLPAGQKAQKGVLIVKIDNDEIEKSYNLSKLSEKITKDQYERAELLFKAGNSSKQLVEEKKNIWIEAQKVLANAKIEFDKTRFFASFDGIIGIPKIRAGTQVQVGDKIVSFYNPSHIIVEFDIPDAIINVIQEGQLVLINEKSYRLNHFQKIIDEETGMCSAYVDIGCKNCIAGTAIDVILSVQHKKDVMVIPFETVFMRNGKAFVYVAQDNKAILTPVELGIREKEEVEITSGLQPSGNIIVLGQMQLYPNMPVKVHNPKEKNF